jgi:phospholipase C
VLQFVEKLTGVKEHNISDWRRSTFGDLTSAFRFDEGDPTPPRLPDTVNTLTRVRYESAYLPEPVLPGAEQVPPVQEPGERKRIPRDTA